MISEENTPPHADNGKIVSLSSFTLAGILIFQSEQNHRLFAFTRIANGSNLPTTHGPWRSSTMSNLREIAEAGGPISIAIWSAIERSGFYLCRPDGVAW